MSFPDGQHFTRDITFYNIAGGIKHVPCDSRERKFWKFVPGSLGLCPMYLLPLLTALTLFTVVSLSHESDHRLSPGNPSQSLELWVSWGHWHSWEGDCLSFNLSFRPFGTRGTTQLPRGVTGGLNEQVRRAATQLFINLELSAGPWSRNCLFQTLGTRPCPHTAPALMIKW